jgi:hypothetical protein
VFDVTVDDGAGFGSCFSISGLVSMSSIVMSAGILNASANRGLGIGVGYSNAGSPDIGTITSDFSPRNSHEALNYSRRTSALKD